MSKWDNFIEEQTDHHEEYLLAGVAPRNLEPCPNLRKIPAGDEVYYFCNLNDHPCLVEYGTDKCEEYEEYLKEEQG